MPDALVPQSIVWLARCDDVFNGYGLTALALTEQAAKDALWATYIEQSMRWNGTVTPHLPNFEALNDYFSVRVNAYQLGVGYFADRDATDPVEPGDTQ